MTNKELQHIAPILSRIKERDNPSGYIIPNQYFDTIESRFFEKSPVSFPKESGHRIPDGYLDTIEDSILSKLNPAVSDIPKDYFEHLETRVFERLANEEKEIQTIALRKYWLTGLVAVAASILLFVGIYKPMKDKPLDTASIESYMMEGNVDVDVYELAEAINDNEINTLESQENLKEDNLENYLLEVVPEEYLYN